MNQIGLEILGIENIQDNDAEKYSGGVAESMDESIYDFVNGKDRTLETSGDININIVAPEGGNLNFGDVKLVAGGDINISIV